MLHSIRLGALSLALVALFAATASAGLDDAIVDLKTLQSVATVEKSKDAFDQLLADAHKKYFPAGRIDDPVIREVKHCIFDFMAAGFHWGRAIEAEVEADAAATRSHESAAQGLFEKTREDIVKLEALSARLKAGAAAQPVD